VIVVEERIGSLVFYLAPSLRAEATPDRILTRARVDARDRLRSDPDGGVVVLREDEIAKFQRLFRVPLRPEGHAGTFSIYRVADLRAALDSGE